MKSTTNAMAVYRQPASLVSENLALQGAPAVPKAQTAITIAVDTNYIGTLPPGTVHAGRGIYMFDNRELNGSRNEGQLELSTCCPAGNLISFHAVPINASASSDTKVKITGFNVSQGSVFTAAGQPQPFPSPAGGPPDSFWIGQALQQGSQTYQIQIQVTIGSLQPVSYFISWDPYITAA